MQKYFGLKKYGRRFKQTIVSLLAFLLVFSGVAPSTALPTVHAETTSSTSDMLSSQVPSYSFNGKNEITAFNAIGPYHLQAIGGSNVLGYDVSNDPKIKGRYVDADNDSSTFSSSSMEYVPNGEVASAFLYISPNNIKSSTDATPTFIQGPKGGKLLFDKSITGVYDITEFVKREGAGQYWGKNLWLQNPLSIPWGQDALANWDIVFVEKNESLPPMMTKLNYYNGVNTGSHPDFKATLSDQPFMTKQEGSLKGSMVASVYGGNKNIDNDQYRIVAYKDNQIVNDSYMSDSARAENNFWNGSITKNGQNISTRNPDRTPANTDIFNFDFTNSPYFPAGVDKVDQMFSAKPINAGGSTDLHYPHFWGVALEVIPPKLEISKTVKNSLKDKTNYEVDDTVVYSVVAKNTVGGTTAKNVIIEDEIPEGLVLVEGTIKASHNAIPEYNNGKITVNFGNVSDTDERIVTFEAKISNDQTGKTINNIASVKGDGLDPIDAQVGLTVDLKSPLLESKKEASIQQKADGNKDVTHPEVGDTLLYKIQTRNTISDSPVKNAVIEDQLPEGLEYVPGTLQVDGKVVTDAEGDDNGHYIQGKVTGKLGDITDAEWHSVTFHAKVKADQAGKTIQNKATVTGDGVPPQEPTTTVEVVTPETPTPPANACGQLGRVALVNGSFEQPYYTSSNSRGPGYFNTPAGTVPGWKTTDSHQVFEIFNKTLMDQIKPGSVEDQGGLKNPVPHGEQFAELNSREAAQLYQDVQTTPGQTIYWRLAHKGRLGTDTMALKIGSSAVHPKDLPTVQQMTTGKDQWKYYTGTYTVPVGQTVTRFGFEAVSSAGGNPAAGNFLDDIFLGTEPCVSATKSVSPEGLVKAGDELTYKVTVKNDGGDVAAKSIFTDTIPTGTEYVPGSIQVIKNGQTSTVTDGKDTDSGDYLDGKVTVDLGDLPNTDILPDGVTIQFKVKALSSDVKQQIKNKANVAYKNLLTNTDGTVDTNEVVNEVEPETPTPPANSCGPMGRVALINGGFEQPPARNVGDKGSPGAEHAWMYFYEHEVPGWKTTATDKFIQIMQNSNEFLGPKMGGNGQTIPVVAAEGKQYAELNANQQSMLYQDVATTPGQTIYWRLAHRGEFGIDTMQLRIGSSNTLPNDLPVIEKISSTNNKWTYYTGSYKVPAGQTMTRFGFDAVSSSNGDLLWGNLLDDIFLGTDPCVSATKSVSPEGLVKAGDELTYKVTVKNDGGDIAAKSIFTDTIPAGTEYVPGSIQVIKNGQTSTVTDGKDTDSGDYLDGRVTVDLGDLPNTDILPDGVTIQFKVKALSSDVKQQIKNKANVAYKSLLTNTDGTVDTNEVVNEVEPETPTPPANSCGQLGRVSLINGSFEEPINVRPFPAPTAPDGVYSLFYSNEVPGWETTASDKLIQIERYVNGFVNISRANGNQFAELNGTQPSTLYQDINTTPGQVIYWRLAHRGDQGIDTMNVKIGATTVPIKDLQSVAQLSTGNQEWKYYTGTYTVPTDQHVTRFAFEAVSTSNGRLDAGNFLDDIFLGTESCVSATKSVSPEGQVKSGDELTYQVKVKNDGGDIAANSIFTDAIPAGTEYVPGSIQVIKNGQASTVTDGKDTDSGEYLDGKVTVNLGDLPNTDILPDGVTVQFKVKVLSGYVNQQIKNKANVAYKNLLTNTDGTVDTNEVVNTVIVKEAKIESKKIAKNLQDKNTEVGDEIEYTIQMRNTVSDSLVKNAVIEDQLPEGLEYVPGTLQVNGKPVTDTEGDDTGHYVQGKFTGQLGDITDTEWHTVVFHAKVKAGQAGQDIQNTAKVTGENVPPQEPSTTVEVYPRNPKVESKKTAKNLQDKNIEVGDEIEYTIQMRNTVSDSLVKNAVIEDQLPEALEYVPGTLQVNGQAVTDAEGDDTGHYVQGKVTGKLGDITDTEWHTVVFHAKVKAGNEGTAIQNTATVTGDDITPQDPTTEIKVQPLGQIEIEKVDAADSTIKLKNAVFQIIDKDGKEVGKLTTDENGKATSELLLLGKYTVKEIKAPDGYMLLKDPIEVEVSSPLQKITVENTKNGWNIPHTGGIGTTLFYLIGMIIMVAALVVFFRKRAKNK
ncbi:isopeptide-forming domain-containing fimbrial protein [Bacillus cereus group sp. BfR-BA-01347]|uniref:isopeptide-forming domain-containing fimbrial protein n=1 Tax=Bacillus cereus group sp. BfR-BA-01347 TaxID=2920310 RepID=UPI001F5645FA|nr:isopeptide-forming domain-containing fimbrial protein [Bacillus cereus group sp. BfR-BA-01347]